MGKYKPSQILIGDTIHYKYFDNVYYTGRVVSKLDTSILMVEKKREGVSEKDETENKMIYVSDVVKVIEQ